jgi:amino acid adenylation domain-containing protein
LDAAPVVRSFRPVGAAHDSLEVMPDDAHDARKLVSSGRALPDVEIVIVDSETQVRRQPRQVGEIWVSGPSVAQGYWERPDAAANAFQQRLPGHNDGCFLRTGDLGFLHDGELFVAGRLKDLIIIRGRNYYPQDIELAVEQSLPALRPGCGAAFSVTVEDEERLVIAYELQREQRHASAQSIAAAMRRAVAEQHELSLYGVVLLKPGSIPKTSSGKIQRQTCKERFLSGNLDIIASSMLDAPDAAPDRVEPNSPPPITCQHILSLPQQQRHETIETFLREQIAQILKVAPLAVDARLPVNSLGLDSLMAVELQHRIEGVLDLVVPMVSFLEETTISQLAARLLTLLTSATPGPAPRTAPGQAGPAHYALSRGQRALWFIHQIAPDSPAYTIVSAIRMCGPLSLSAFQGALEQIVRRHPTLRSTFASVHGEPTQRVLEDVEVALHIADASGWSDEQLNANLLEEARRPFDLEQGPLLRVRLLERSPQEHMCLLVLHHIVADLWSIDVLVHELRLLYQSQGATSPVPLPNIAASYADYVGWQETLLASPEGARLQDYWCTQLKGELPLLNLPIDKPRQTFQTYNGASVSFRLNSHLTQHLKAFAEQQNLTFYMLLLAAFQIVLHRLSGQDDILVGSPTTGRSRSAFANLIGYFVNPIVLRSRCAGDPTGLTFLEQVRRTVLDALAHQDYPFATLVERLQPKRDPARSPVFQATFAFQKAHLDESLSSFVLAEPGLRLTIGDLTMEPLPIDLQAAQFELALTMAMTQGNLAGSLQFNSDLIEHATAQRIVEYLQIVLDQIAAHPERRLSTFLPLPAPERRLLLEDWNESYHPYTYERSIHQRFEDQVERTPDAIAVVFDLPTADHRPTTNDQRRQGDKETRRQGGGEAETQHSTLNTQNFSSILHPQCLTYRQLNERANQVAHELRKHQVGPERLVGLCFDRSPELVIGLLAVLKAGGGYIALDPTYPTERLAFMLEDARAAVLLTQKQLFEHGAHSGLPLVCLDSDWQRIAEHSRDNLACRTNIEQVAYVVYTSGSSGRPKGTLVSNRGLLNLCLWYRDHCPIDERSKVLLMISLSFDAAFKNILTPLLSGGELILGNAGYYNPVELLGIIEANQVTVINATPSLLHPIIELAESNQYASLSSIEYVGLGGEPLEISQITPWLDSASCRCRLFNIYGPTECSDISTSYAVPASDRVGPRSVPIGRPIDNMQAYVLDRYGNLQPIGVAGELCISGAGVARGYLDNPALTAEKFAPNPFLKDEGRRMKDKGGRFILHPSSFILYKTGDLARWLPSGELEFLGRFDSQVKIRGLRIELGEIAGVLNQHPALREAVVLVSERQPGDRRLVAYVVPKVEDRGLKIEDSIESAPDPLSSILYPLSSELRTFLKAHLPEYMVPSAFVLVESIPLTPNGKVDVHALSLHQSCDDAEATTYEPPASDMEQTIAEIWQQLLEIDKVGRHDNFFDLGGHSLLVVRAYAKLRATYDIELQMLDMFKYPTIHTLASYLAQRTQRESAVSQDDGLDEKMSHGKARLHQQRALRQQLARGAEESHE